MKLLGKLKANSLATGDLIEVSGFLSVVTSVFVDGVKVVIETDKLHPFELCFLDEIKVYSSFN